MKIYSEEKYNNQVLLDELIRGRDTFASIYGKIIVAIAKGNEDDETCNDVLLSLEKTIKYANKTIDDYYYTEFETL